MKIRIETRFAPGDLVFLREGEEDLLAIIEKVQYDVSTRDGKTVEVLRYLCRVVGSSRYVWTRGNDIIRRKPKLYSILEQHVDGRWWYHPNMTSRTAYGACMKVSEWMRETRPVIVVEHDKAFPPTDWHTLDFENFGEAGDVPSLRMECRVLGEADEKHFRA